MTIKGNIIDKTVAQAIIEERRKYFGYNESNV